MTEARNETHTDIAQEFEKSGVLAKATTVEEATLQGTVAGAVVARNDAHINSGVSLISIAGHDSALNGSFGGSVLVGHDADLQGSGAGIMLVQGNVRTDRGLIMLLVSRGEITGDGNKVLMTLPVAIVFSAILGVSFALARLLIKPVARHK